MQPARSAGKHVISTKGGKHATPAKRGKICDKRPRPALPSAGNHSLVSHNSHELVQTEHQYLINGVIF